MSGVKHTPGPWRTSGVYIDSDHGTVGHANFSDDLTAGSPAANARLIAAAPDLLEAAEWADKALERYVDALGLDQTDEAALIALYKIKDAIARARGEQDGGAS